MTEITVAFVGVLGGGLFGLAGQYISSRRLARDVDELRAALIEALGYVVALRDHIATGQPPPPPDPPAVLAAALMTRRHHHSSQ